MVWLRSAAHRSSGSLTITDVADPIATANDVAEVLGCTHEAARVKLAQLVEDGRVERQKVGSTAGVWWPTNHEGEENSVEALREIVECSLREKQAMFRSDRERSANPSMMKSHRRGMSWTNEGD